MNIAQFLDKRVPVPMRADAYTISSDSFASGKARERSIYNYTNRISPAKTWPEVAKDSRMVFFGLFDYIRHELTDRVTYDDIIKSKLFMERAGSFGTGLAFNEEMWMDVLYDYNGYLPITIEAVREGSTFFPNEPVIQVTSNKGFGELAAHVEAIMLGQVAIATARATLTRHWYQTIVDFMVGTGQYTLEEAQAVAVWFIHDFGMRASANELESRVLGKAHLLTFNGTDTFNAAYEAWKDSDPENIPPGMGTSILALAHRNVQGYEHFGNLGEFMTFRAINEAARNCGNIASYVSDCYDFGEAVKKCGDLALSTGSIVVCRPDSGDAKSNIMKVIQVAFERNLTVEFNNNGTITFGAKSLRFIEGNSVRPKLSIEVLEMLYEKGLKVGAWGIFGVGGYLRNECTRDALSSKYALAAIGEDEYPVCKLSENRGKMTVPGRVALTPPMNGNPIISVHHETPNHDFYNTLKVNRLETYYTPGNFDHPALLEDFNIKRDRCHEEFDSYREFALAHPDFGLDCSHLDNIIVGIRETTYTKYRGEKRQVE